MSLRKCLLLICLALAGEMVAPAAFALNCWMSSGNAQFGSVNAGSAASTHLNNDITCNNQEGDDKTRWVKVCVAVNPEQPVMHTDYPRYEIKYNIYQHDKPNRPLGPNQYAVLVEELPPGKQETFDPNLIAKIAANQNTPAGLYRDTMNETYVHIDYYFSETKLGIDDENCKTQDHQEAISPIGANVEIINGCDQLSVTDLNFGSYSPVNSAQLTASASAQVSLKCPIGTKYTISMDMGQHSAGNSRQICNDKNNECVNYELYQDPAHSRPWDNHANKLTDISSTGDVQAVPVYGYVAPQRWPSAGDYKDTIVVTLSY